jgi:hypothetical protein
MCWVGMRRDTEGETPDGWQRTGGPGQDRKSEAILKNLGRRGRQEEGRSSAWARFSNPLGQVGSGSSPFPHFTISLSRPILYSGSASFGRLPESK